MVSLTNKLSNELTCDNIEEEKNSRDSRDLAYIITYPKPLFGTISQNPSQTLSQFMASSDLVQIWHKNG